MGTFQNIQRENEQHSQTLIQPQLEVGEEDDEHEKEANHVADKVMKMSDPDEKKKKMSEGTEKIQKMSSGKEEEKMKDEDEGKIQKMSDGPVTINKMSDGNGSMAAPQNVEQGINSTKGNGQSLPADTQQELGSKMNADFSDVNIHTDSNAVQMNKEIGAKAFTHGNDIYFNQGQYNPNSNTGKHLLAHELTHTVQQGNGKTMLNKQQNSLVNDPEEDLGNKLLTQYPQGIPVMIYDTNYGDVFKVQSEQWAKRNNAVGLKGETFVANEVLFGKAIPNEMSRPNQDNVLETLAIDQVITQFGALLQSAVKKAEIKKQSENSNYVPNDNAYKIKTLAIGSHGWCGHTSAGLSEENYIDYIKNISPYLTTDVNVILYACNTATGKDENPGGSWGDLKSGGNDSLAADIRDQLADSGHTGARVWGHSATGHFLDTWPLRYFDASSKGQPGESFFDYVFKDQISTNTNDVVNEINNQNYEISDPLQLQFITDKTREKVYPYYYDAYKLAMNTEEYPQVTNGKTEMVNLAEAAPTAPDPVAAIIRTTFDTSYKSKIPTALKLANSIIPIVKPKLLKKQ